MVGFYFRDSGDVGIVHDDGITFGMAVAFVVAVNFGDENLFGFILSYGTGYYIGMGIFAVQVDFEIAFGKLVAVR